MSPDMLIAGLPVAGVGLIVAAGILTRGRDPEADQHSVADYRPPAEPSRMVDGYRRRLAEHPGLLWFGDMPPAPVTERCPLYAEVIVAQVAARYGATTQERASRMLREIAERVPAGQENPR